MIYIIFSLFLFALWYVADKQLGERFENYLKWLSLAVIVFFVLYDINLMMETNRMIDVRLANPLGFSYTDPTTNVTTTMFGSQTQDTSAVIAYHVIEMSIWPVFTGLLPAAFIGIAGFIVIQIMRMWYDQYTMNYKGDKIDNKNKKGVFDLNSKRD